jgi:hypothetical protein
MLPIAKIEVTTNKRLIGVQSVATIPLQRCPPPLPKAWGGCEGAKLRATATGGSGTHGWHPRLGVAVEGGDTSGGIEWGRAPRYAAGSDFRGGAPCR